MTPTSKACWIQLLALGCSLTWMPASFAESFHDFKLKSIQGEVTPLSQYKGKAVLVVNTASQCGYTSQYKGLQKIYDQYQKQGLVVLGFPSNDFGGQEPAANPEIKKFCEINYGVKFPLFEKGPVRGPSAQPLFKWLTQFKSANAEGEIRWNFEKFLISPEGKVQQRFRSGVDPESPELTSEIERALQKKS